MLKNIVCTFGFLSIFSVSVSASIITGNSISDSGNTSLITNGSFEADLSSWTQLSFGRGAFIHSTTSISGSGSAASSPSFSFNGSGFALQSDSITVIPNENYILSGFINTANMTTGQVFIDLADAPFDINLGPGELTLGSSELQFVYAQFTPTVSNIRVRLVMDGNVTFGESALFDSISVTKASEFVAPSIISIPVNQAPNGVIDTPANNIEIIQGQTVNFTATGTDVDNNLPLEYLWTFGAGSGVADSSVEDPGNVIFNNTGVFTVIFSVTDSLGLIDPSPASMTVTVNAPAPTSPASPTPVPTLSEWSVIILTVILFLIGFRGVRRI